MEGARVGEIGRAKDGKRGRGEREREREAETKQNKTKKLYSLRQ